MQIIVLVLLAESLITSIKDMNNKINFTSSAGHILIMIDRIFLSNSREI